VMRVVGRAQVFQHDSSVAVGGMNKLAVAHIDSDMGYAAPIGVSEKDQIARFHFSSGNGAPVLKLLLSGAR